MSTESAKTMRRQWHIVRFLLKGTYVSTSEINNHLISLNIDVGLRTIQRDLKVLKDVFPLESRQDCRPHSWRWQRAEDTTIGEINLSKALVLCFVQEHLTDVLSPKLIQQLDPLFEKAKVVVGMAAEDKILEKNFKIEQELPEKPIKMGMIGGGYALPFTIAHKIFGWFDDKKPSQIPSSPTTDIFLVLANVLQEADLDELARDFK